MSCTLIFEQGNAPVLQVIVRNALTGLYINDAAVAATLRDSAAVEVTGEAWPAVLGYVAGSNGVYRRQLAAGIGLVTGQTYEAAFTISSAGVTRTLKYSVVVTDPGCGDVAPATAPESPAYRGPALLTLLNEAEAAYHRLNLGLSARVVVDQNGERVEYTAANAPRLAQYILSLKAQLGLLTAAYRAPAGVTF
jgi:hypothetical protein